MSRIQFTIGKPPGPPEATQEWRRNLDELARILIDGLRGLYRDDRVKVRRAVIEAAREALSEAPSDPMCETILVDRDVLDEECLAIAGAFRLALEVHDLDHRDQTRAESVMDVIQRALDDVLESLHIDQEWRAKIDKCARMMTAMALHFRPEADRADLLSEVMEHAREALSDAPSGPMFHKADVQNPDGTVESQDVGSPAGMFRLVIAGFQWSDPGVAETVASLIRRGAETEWTRLVPSKPDRRRRPRL